MQRIASFDVFDTVITRAVGTPSAVFLLLGRILKNMSLIGCTPEAFACVRIDAERRATKNAEDGAVSLRQIYAEVQTSLGLTEEYSLQLMNLECELEAKVIRAVPGARDRIQNARNHGRRVLFLSDMYLSSAFIQKQLSRHGLWMDGDECYVSCEYGKSKRSGKLFRELLCREGVPPESIVHCGNHPDADVQIAKHIGLHVEPFLDGNPNRYELILDSHIRETEGLSSAMAGASKLARLTVPAKSLKEEILRDVAAGVIAPLLVGYVLWILRRAQQLRLKRLCFVSRDGQILFGIARRLINKLNIACKLQYLYGSRQSWNLPAITRIDQEQLAWIWDLTGFPTVRNVLSRVCIKPEEIKENLNSIGITEKRWSVNLPGKEISAISDLLLEDRRLHELILQRASQKRSVILKYLSQEGLLDTVDWGMVDVGWLGSLQDSLERILTAEGKKLPHGFYFGLRKNPLGNQLDRREAYFFDERLGLGFVDIFPRYGLLKWMEAFCSADHGTVVGFEEEGKEVRPVLKENGNQPLLEWGLLMIQKTVYCFTENLLLDSRLINVDADVHNATAEALKAFCLKPSLPEVKAFADFPVEIGFGKDSYMVHLAERYRWKHIVNSFRASKAMHDHPAIWHEGALLLTPPLVRLALKTALFVSHTLRCTIRPLKHLIRRKVLILAKQIIC